MSEKKAPKRAKWLIGLLVVIAAAVWIWDRAAVVVGHEGLIGKAWEEIPFSIDEPVSVSIAGSIGGLPDRHELIWFVVEDANHLYDYFPAEFKHVHNRSDHFRFVKAYIPEVFVKDIAVYPWYGFAILVNNEACKTVVLEYEDGTAEEIEVTGYLPFLYHTDKTPMSRRFLDEYGNEIS